MTRRDVARRTRRSRALARRLGELDARNPVEIRRAVLRTVCEAADGIYAVFHDVIATGGGVSVSEVLTHGACDARSIEKALREVNSGPVRVIEKVTVLSCFSSPRHVYPSWAAYVASPTYQKAFKPHGAHDIGGLIVYHGQTLVGAASAAFAAPRRFTETDRDILQPLVTPVQAALTAAHCLRREGLPDETAYLIVRPDGRFEHASAQATAWVRRRALVAAVRRRVRELDRGREPQESSALEQAEARIVRLRTDDGIRYLVCLRPASLVRRTGAPLLTPLQLRIALAATDGATAAEIARDLGRGVETVREHLATAYRKLGVSTRMELMRALQDQDR